MYNNDFDNEKLRVDIVLANTVPKEEKYTFGTLKRRKQDAAMNWCKHADPLG
jgi:hypothetical protein